MPPETEVVPPPTTGGRDAAEYLAACGLIARTPTIRSSDAGLAESNPFIYYLTRRLGLSDPFRWSKALSRGSWAHKRMEVVAESDPSTIEAFRRRTFALRAAEIEATAESLMMAPAFAPAFLQREEEDSIHAFAWLDAILDVPLPELKLPRGLRAFLTEDHHIFGHEMRAVHTDERRFGHCPLVAQFDALLHHHSTNTVWVFDFKTVDGKKPRATTNRLLTCPWEFQTIHYLHVAHRLMQARLLHPNIPHDARLGGMLHVSFAKPSISLCNEDRAFTTTQHTLKSGPRKGQIEERREHFGVPLRENYLARCRHWLLGTGPYSELRPERENGNPCINFSKTSSKILDTPRFAQYLERVSHIYSLATRAPHPDDFHQTSEGLLRDNGEPSPFAAFFAAPPLEWPRLVTDRRLVQAWRDEDLIS